MSSNRLLALLAIVIAQVGQATAQPSPDAPPPALDPAAPAPPPPAPAPAAPPPPVAPTITPPPASPVTPPSIAVPPPTIPTGPHPEFPPLPIAFYPRDGNYIGVELGFARVADPRNGFGDGPGKTVVIGIHNWETRFYERYDMEDRSDPDVYGDAQGVRAKLSITSFGKRILFGTSTELVAIRLLVGGAWIRRDSVRPDPDALISRDFDLRPQHGLAAMIGGGIQFGPLTAEVRAYPTWWQSIDVAGRYMAPTTDPAPAPDESPGGIPITFTIGLGFGFSGR